MAPMIKLAGGTLLQHLELPLETNFPARLYSEVMFLMNGADAAELVDVRVVGPLDRGDGKPTKMLVEVRLRPKTATT